MGNTELSNQSDVSKFLCVCKIAVKLNFILERTDKNKKTISYLGYVREDVIEEIMDLEVEDYVEGPIEDRRGYAKDFWVFGKIIQDKELYIKLKVKDFDTTGHKRLSGLCISFHFSEEKLIYPYKK